MSLKRKRETETNNDLGSPKKKQKSNNDDHDSIQNNHNIPPPATPSITNLCSTAMLKHESIEAESNSNDTDMNEAHPLNQKKGKCASTDDITLDTNSNEQKIEEDTDPNNVLITASSPLKATDAHNKTTDSPYKLAKQKQYLKNNGFWRQIDELDLIVPPPDRDLCDRHLVLIHTDSQSGNDEEEKENVNGLESLDEEEVTSYNLLANCSLDAATSKLLESMHETQYRVVSIANYALRITSEYFRNLLSRSSSFAECSSDFVVIKLSVCYAFSMELLLRLLHLNQSDLRRYLSRVENHKTLLQLLLLCDEYQIKHISQSIMDRLQFIAMRDRPKKVQTNNSKFVRHVSDGFNPSFDNGGMTISQVSNLLFVGEDGMHLECLEKIVEIGRTALSARYRQLRFNKYGIVDSAFRKLPSIAITTILTSNEFCSYSENDIFLACTQWAAYPLHDDDEDDDGYTMNPQDNKQEIVIKRFNTIWHNIRYDAVDAWYLDCCVQYYEAIKQNNDALVKILHVVLKRARVSGSSSGIRRRVMPSTAAAAADLEYDTFVIVFDRRDLVEVALGQRLTSEYMIWRGIVFALDIVRKEKSNENTDSVGLFLYCQGIEFVDRLWIKYSLKTCDHQHALHCSDYKVMMLNFQKGNGSRDFFGCDWMTFLNTRCDKNDQIQFELTFIDAQ
eukprot:110177_1